MILKLAKKMYCHRITETVQPHSEGSVTLLQWISVSLFNQVASPRPCRYTLLIMDKSYSQMQSDIVSIPYSRTEH